MQLQKLCLLTPKIAIEYKNRYSPEYDITFSAISDVPLRPWQLLNPSKNLMIYKTILQMLVLIMKFHLYNGEGLFFAVSWGNTGKEPSIPLRRETALKIFNLKPTCLVAVAVRATQGTEEVKDLSVPSFK